MKLRAFITVLACTACGKPVTPTATAPVAEPAPTAPAPDAGVPPPTAMPAGPASSGFARYDDAASGKAPWITDAEVKQGVAELVAIQLPGGKATFTTRRVCGAEAKAAIDQLGAMFVARTRDASHAPVACVQGPPPRDKVVCAVVATDDEDVSIALDYRKTGPEWRLVGLHRSTLDAARQPAYAKLEAQYDKLLETSCK